jgi:hypothetical protein
MAGIRMRFHAAPEAVMGNAARLAQQLGHTVVPLGPQELSIASGSLALSIVIGAFVAYCDFRAWVQQLPDGTTELTLRRNRPWWTGLIGVGRVKKKAGELADAIAGALAVQGMPLLDRAEF